MSCLVTVPPYALPVHLNDVKNHLKQDVDLTADDALITAQILAAVDVIETATGANVRRHRVILASTFELKLCAFPGGGVIEIPRTPLVSVSSITYVDTAGDAQTLATTAYSVRVNENRIVLAYNQAWPSTRGGYEDQVTITFVAGMVAPFSAAASTDVLTISGRSFTVGDRVRVTNSGGRLPTGLAENTDYFVIAGPKLSLTSGGADVGITAPGDGTHYIGLDLKAFASAQAACKLEIGKLYTDRGDGRSASLEQTQMTINSLVAAIHA